MRLAEKMAQAQLKVLQTTDDAWLTAEELSKKYDEAAERQEAKSPRQPLTPSSGCRASGWGGTCASRHSGVASHSVQFDTTHAVVRCFACDTALRNPSASYFSCGAAEPYRTRRTGTKFRSSRVPGTL